MIALRHEIHYGDRLMRCIVDRPKNVIALLDDAVARRPDGIAIVAGDRRISYRALAAEVEAIAAHFAAHGLVSGERIGLLLGNRPEFLVTILAAARLGLIVVPMTVRQSLDEVSFMLTQCGAAAIVYDVAFAAIVPELPALRARFVVDGAPAFHPVAAADLPPAPVVDVASEAPFCILYTSGTTGRPKGAVLTHLGVLHSVLHYEDAFAFQEGEVGALAVPASHVTGLVAVLLTALRVAGTAVILEGFKARSFLETMARERVTFTLMVPAMYHLCLLDPELGNFDLSSWKLGGFGGAPMPSATIARLAEALPGLTLCNAYGATETTSPATILPRGQAATRPGRVGKPGPCADIVVVDADGCEVPPGERGELLIAGPMTIPGYWDNPDANRPSFVGGYWRSGDIGSIDADGYVSIHDRMKDVINRGGYKIYCIEVENVIAQLPQVIECAVTGYPDPVLGERVQAFIHADPARPVSAEDLRAACAARLSDYKVPERFTFLDAPMPRNANGKIVKSALREAATLPGLG